MSIQKQDQETQLRNSDVYDDTKSPGSGLEAPGASDKNLLFDLNAIRSLIKSLGGQADWFTGPDNSFTLKAIHDKFIAFRMPHRPAGANASKFTLSGSAGGVLLDASLFSGAAGKIAVGASSAENGGYIAADEALFTVAGTLGVGLSKAEDAEAILINSVAILDDDTNDMPKDVDGEDVFGLLQVISGTSDGAAIAAAASENLQISFVKYDKSSNLIVAVSLPAKTYLFSPIRQRYFQAIPRGVMLPGGSLPNIIDPVSGELGGKMPFREIDITGTLPAANDAMTVTTGTFATAGAQSVFSSNATPAMPASGAEFRDDSRVKVYRNGQKLSKGADASDNRDVYWVSTTQIAFEDALKADEVIRVESPSTF